ncbi:hypothetical protein OG21DRAFT_1478027 [Imleria badia]|nr:hypothetical protein OG21DRAFT_1478027 [Imleria badia]
MSSGDATSNQHPETREFSEGSRRPIYKTETTGDYWQDVWIAFKRLGEMPCARNSLLSGIASGAGVGFIRAMSASPFVASNWAVGTFMLISLGTWTVCRKNVETERRRLSRVVEEMPKRFIKQKETKDGISEGVEK